MQKSPRKHLVLTRRVTLAQALEAFELRCQAQNLSPLTCGWYDQILRLLYRFLEAQGLLAAAEVQPEHIRRYLSHLRAQGNASGTISRSFGAMRCFFSFLAREGLVAQSPMASLEKPRLEQKLIRPLSLDQCRRLLAQPATKTFLGLRLWTIMVLILDTGLRLGEVFALRIDQLDLQLGYLRIMGKGGKEREVPLGAGSKQALWRYLARRGKIPGQERVFVTRFGTNPDRRSIERAFQRAGARAEIQGVRVSPHTLRHTFATHYIMNGGDMFSLQKILGHSTLEMVKVYVRMANRDVKLQHQRFSPLEKLGALPGGSRRVVVQM